MYQNKETIFRNQIIRLHSRLRNETLLKLFCSLADETSTDFVYLYGTELKLIYAELVRRGLDDKVSDRIFAVEFCKTK